MSRAAASEGAASSPEGSPPAAPDGDQLRRSARAVLDANWREPGFTCPNGTTYPWLWLWDSCFHSIVWAELGEPEPGRVVVDLVGVDARPGADKADTLAIERRDGGPGPSLEVALARLPAWSLVGRRYRRSD
mgnify:CR=1 FL=1